MKNKILAFLLTLSPSLAMEIEMPKFETQAPEKKRLVHNLWVIDQFTQDTYRTEFPKEIRVLIHNYEKALREPFQFIYPSPHFLGKIVESTKWKTEVYKIPNPDNPLGPEISCEYIKGAIKFIKDGVQYTASPFLMKSATNSHNLQFVHIALNSWHDENYIKQGSTTSLYSYVSDYKNNSIYTISLAARPLDDLGSPLKNPTFKLVLQKGVHGSLRTEPAYFNVYTTSYELVFDSSASETDLHYKKIYHDDLIIMVSDSSLMK